MMMSVLRILHLEDDSADADLVRSTLEAEGIPCDIVRVVTRDDFLEAIEKYRFDLLFADYSLPSFDGLSALTIAKGKCSDTPFIFISGKMGEDLAIESLKSGATDYVLKNKLSRLVPSVHRALREARERLERRKAEEELRRSREELRSLSAHLQTAREEERAHIAREIHDELGQILMALNMDVSWLRNKFKDHELISAKSKEMMNIINAAIKEVKRISAKLRPAVLDDLGLAAAIEWQAKDFQKRTGIVCTVVLTPVILDKECSIALFRIVQEALTNVIRHANATRITVSLEKKDREITLNIEDNGKGIPGERLRGHQSFGLIGMRERVISLGGKLEITGIDNKGTTVTVNIPTDATSDVILQ